MAANRPSVYDNQFFNAGTPAAGYKLYTYDSGTTTPKATYTDQAGTIPNTNPITLDADGRCELWLGAGEYTVALYTRAIGDGGALVMSRDDVAGAASMGELAAADALLRADLASAANPAKGAGMVGYRKNYVAAVAQLVSTPLDCIVSISDFMSPTQVAEMMAGVGKPDITAEFQAAVNALPRQGTPTWQQWKLLAPIGVATISATVNIFDQQGGELHLGGCQLEGNFAGPILQIGDSSGSNDVLRFHVYGGSINQASTAAGSGAVKAARNYSCSYNSVYMTGGRIAFELDGNANVMNACAFRSGRDANVKTGATANNECNLFLGCGNELSFGRGYDLSVTAGVGGFTHILGGYCERNATGSIYAANSMKAIVEGVYFNLQDGASGIVLGGTVGASYQEPFIRASDNRIEGPATGTPPKFIEELSASSINAQYEGNTIRAGLCDLYGSAGKSVNLRRHRDRVYLQNADAFSGGPPPTGWTLVGPGPVATAATVSPYGSTAAIKISGASYLHQTVKCPANALIRVSCWALTSGTDATLQLWDAALTGQYVAAQTTSATATRLEAYLTPAMRSNATSFAVLLRNVAGVGDASFSDFVIEDLTN